MSHVYFAQTRDTQASIEASFYPPTLGLQADTDKRLARVKNFNPQLPDNKKLSLACGSPILLPGDNESSSLAFQQLKARCSLVDGKALSDMSAALGGANTLAIARFLEKHRFDKIAPDLNTFGGAGLGAATTRASRFLQALGEYDAVVNQYKAYSNHRAAPATLARLDVEAKASFRKLQTEFQREMTAVMSSEAIKTRPVEVSSAAGRRMASMPIPLRTHGHAQSLAKLAKVGKVMGPGFIALDGYFRYSTVEKMKRNGGRWRREAFAQGAGLAFAVTLGGLFFTMLIGSFGLIVGVVVAGASAILLDRLMVTGARGGYDAIGRSF